MRSPLQGLVILASAGFSSLAMAAPNGDFSEVKPFPEDTHFGVVDIGNDTGLGFLPSWTILTFLGDVGIEPRDPSATVSIADSPGMAPTPPDPLVGSGVFTFEQLTNRFGDSRLEQCIPIDENLDIRFLYHVRTNRSAANNSLRVRLNSSGTGDNDNFSRNVIAHAENLIGGFVLRHGWLTWQCANFRPMIDLNKWK